MSVDIQIVEHKDCIRCYQPIDVRAHVCPFCHSEQTVPANPRWRYALGAVALLLFVILPGWLLVQRNQQALEELGAQLDVTQQQLETVVAVSDARREEKERTAEAALSEASDELRKLIVMFDRRPVLEYSLCESDILSRCSEILANENAKVLLLSKMMGKFDLLGAEDVFCDQVRPMLKTLAQQSSSRMGSLVFNKYYAATSACRSG